MTATVLSQRPTAAPSENLRYWLANEDWYMSRYTRTWLDRTPSELAADTLAQIAEGAQPEPKSLLSRMLLLMAYSGFATSSGIAGSGPGDRKAGTRAALMLANMGDDRAIAPLTRVFNPYGFWKSKYQENIEEALARFLTDATEQGEVKRHVSDVRHIIEATWLPGLGKRDLTPSLTAFMIAGIRYLRASGGAENALLLREIAEANIPGRLTNRVRVKQAAI